MTCNSFCEIKSCWHISHQLIGWKFVFSFSLLQVEFKLFDYQKILLEGCWTRFPKRWFLTLKKSSIQCCYHYERTNESSKQNTNGKAWVRNMFCSNQKLMFFQWKKSFKLWTCQKQLEWQVCGIFAEKRPLGNKQR